MPALRIEEFQDKLRECTIFGSIDIKETYHQIAIDMKIAYLCVIRTTLQWGSRGSQSYPNISDFIAKDSPKNLAKILLFTVGYPNLKVLTSSLILIAEIFLVAKYTHNNSISAF